MVERFTKIFAISSMAWDFGERNSERAVYKLERDGDHLGRVASGTRIAS
jgi:hypothetical protein